MLLHLPRPFLPAQASASTVDREELQGWRLHLARLVWLIIAAMAVGLVVAGLGPRAQAVVGVTVTEHVPGQILLSPWVGGPALRAGILEGDTLVAVDGVPVQRLHARPGQDLIPSGLGLSPTTLDVRTGTGPVRHYVFDRYPLVVDLLVAALITLVAALIVWVRGNERAALVTALTLMLVFVGCGDSTIALYRTQPAWQPALDLWFAAGLCCLCLCLCVFPNGRFVPRWTAVPLALAVPWALLGLVIPALYPWHLAWPGGFLWIVAALLAGVVAQVYRYVYRATPAERQQTLWVVLGLPAGVVGMLALLWHSAWATPLTVADFSYASAVYAFSRLCLVALPLTLALALLRYRLWDVDLILNRALVYGALTACVVALYVLGVSDLSAAFRTSNNATISLIATAVVALLFQPLRSWLQRGVDRLMFGERGNPRGLLWRLDQRLALALPPDAVLPLIVETLATALKLPYVAIALTQAPGSEATHDRAGAEAGGSAEVGDERIVARYGHLIGTPLRLPLVYGAETAGYLYVAPRVGETHVSSADRRVFTAVAAHAGVVAHAARLSADVQRARERLVTAREEERRRLRRDLHDGLGPRLAGLTLTLGAARTYLSGDPARAAALLDTVSGQAEEAMTDVRRLVYALRPPALDDLGLVGALRDQAERYAVGPLEVRVEAPASLPPLSAAVEVAAYRICLEALTNVARHAQAHRCVIRLHCLTDLELEICDDGRGIAPDQRAGVGVRSMRERAEELGGCVSIGPGADGGTCVRAVLPRGEA